MGLFSKYIERKFISLAGEKYEEILKSYFDFLLTEEERKVPEVERILMPLDRYSSKVPENVFPAFELFKDAKIFLVYIIEENIVRLIRETLGEEEAIEYVLKEEADGKKVLRLLAERFTKMGFVVDFELKRGEGINIIGNLSEDFNLIFVSKHFGSEPTKTHMISPLVFSLLQIMNLPLVLYG